jgi:hypothetical protein
MPKSVTVSAVAAKTTCPLFRAAFSVLLGQAGQEIHWVVNQLETQALRLAEGFMVSHANEHEARAGRGGQVSVAARRSWLGTAQDFLLPRTPCLGGGLRPSKIALSRLALPLGNGGDDCCSRDDRICTAPLGRSQRQRSEIRGGIRENASALARGSGHHGVDGSCSLAAETCLCPTVWPRLPCDSLVAPLGPRPPLGHPRLEALM